MNALRASTCYLRGLRAGYRLAGRSLGRRWLVTLLVTAILWGISLGVAWEVVDRFARLETGQPISKVVLTKVQSYLRVYPSR